MRKRTAAGLAFVAAFALTLIGSPAQSSDAVYFYTPHVADIGWMPTVWDGEQAGTTGEARRLEAIDFTYPGQRARGHVENIGWMPWVDGQGVVGTTGRALRLEAVTVESGVPGVAIHCQAHVQDVGWLAPVGDGEQCGTTGLGLRLEAVRLWIEYVEAGS